MTAMPEHAESPADIEVRQHGFDPLGPQVRTAALNSGRTVHYIDEGDPDWQTLVFFGGAGTTVRAFGLLEFARTLREQLHIRVISVERNGLGQTTFDPGVGLAEYADDVWALLDHRGVSSASLIAISGGGPYAAHVAAAQPRRVRSVHLACAWAEHLSGQADHFDPDAIASDPAVWWQFPEGSSIHRIPGFVDSAIEEATRGSFARGRDVPPDGLAQAFGFYQDSALPDLGRLEAPAFLYWGDADPLVPPAHMERWRAALPHVHAARVYEGEGHDVQYRHWDQILTDVAHLGECMVVCHEGRTVLVSPERASELLERGAAYGLCAWA